MLSDDLKAQTRRQHDAAEGSPAMRAVMSDGLAHSDYRDHLARLLGFYTPLEAALAKVDGLDTWVPGLDDRLVKTGWLAEDLSALDPGPMAPTGHMPALGVAEALGVLYVVEGSTLGGRLIERHLQRTLGLTPHDGARFYHSYGEARGPRWTTFKAALDAYGEAHPDAASDVIAAAADTVQVFSVWLAAPLGEEAHV